MRFFSIPSFTRSAGPAYSQIPDHEDPGRDRQNNEGDENVVLELPAETRSRRLRALRRTFFVYILPAVILLLVLVVALIVVKTRGHSGGGEPQEDSEPDDSESIANDARLEKYQTPSDALYCMPWPTTASDSRSSSETQTAQISFDITASDLVFFISRGHATKGHLAITADRMQRSESITVNITAEYSNLEDLKKTKACFAGEEHSESGVMIWADSATRLPTFNISVEIPWTQFRDFSTDFSTGVYSQEISDTFDIWNPVSFEIFRLRGANAAISTGGVFTESAFIQTTNAEVRASFFSSDAVHVRTTNSPIRAVVWGLGQTDGATTEVSVKTKDADVLAALALMSDFKAVNLNASIHTTNGVLNVTMPRMPVLGTDYSFNVDASTTNAASRVFVSPDYAGRFDLQTSRNGKAQVQWDPTMRDPSGKGRKHVLDMESNDGRHKLGKVYWGEEEPSTLGEIRMESTEEDVWLYTNQEIVDEADVFSLYGRK